MVEGARDSNGSKDTPRRCTILLLQNCNLGTATNYQTSRLSLLEVLSRSRHRHGTCDVLGECTVTLASAVASVAGAAPVAGGSAGLNFDGGRALPCRPIPCPRNCARIAFMQALCSRALPTESWSEELP